MDCFPFFGMINFPLRRLFSRKKNKVTSIPLKRLFSKKKNKIAPMPIKEEDIYIEILCVTDEKENVDQVKIDENGFVTATLLVPTEEGFGAKLSDEIFDVVVHEDLQPSDKE